MRFKPERVKRSASFLVNGSVEKIFPLFGPIREMEWAYGWNPEVIFQDDNTISEHMIFRTPGEGELYLWAITRLDVQQHIIEYTVTAANRLWFITVQCVADLEKTCATVTYSYTALNETGHSQNRKAIEKMFEYDLADWQKAIDHYLETGNQLH